MNPTVDVKKYEQTVTVEMMDNPKALLEFPIYTPKLQPVKILGDMTSETLTEMRMEAGTNRDSRAWSSDLEGKEKLLDRCLRKLDKRDLNSEMDIKNTYV